MMTRKKEEYRSPTNIFRNKRAQNPETQFNWVFILIVGALIIAFFTVIIMKQKDASEVKISGKLTQQLNTIFVGARVSSGTVQEIPTPFFAVRFTCNAYYIGAANQPLGNRILFAPEEMEGNRIITWTLDWSAPFKVNTFLYVTNHKTRYVLVRVTPGDTNDFKRLNTSLPVKLNRNFNMMEYDSSSGSEYMGLQRGIESHTRFIFVGGDAGFDPVVPDDFIDSPGSALQLFTGQNKMRFFDIMGASFTDLTTPTPIIPGGPVPYLDQESMLGAVFTDNPDIYSCVINKAWVNWNLVAQVFYEKFNDIGPTYAGTNCDGFYSNNLDFETIMTQTSQGFDLENDPEAQINSLAGALEGLRRTNERAQLGSCPLLY